MGRSRIPKSSYWLIQTTANDYEVGEKGIQAASRKKPKKPKPMYRSQSLRFHPGFQIIQLSSSRKVTISLEQVPGGIVGFESMGQLGAPSVLIQSRGLVPSGLVAVVGRMVPTPIALTTLLDLGNGAAPEYQGLRRRSLVKLHRVSDHEAFRHSFVRGRILATRRGCRHQSRNQIIFAADRRSEFPSEDPTRSIPTESVTGFQSLKR